MLGSSLLFWAFHLTRMQTATPLEDALKFLTPLLVRWGGGRGGSFFFKRYLV
jgi:hypothetical protein